jgi:hypothetical protein
MFTAAEKRFITAWQARDWDAIEPWVHDGKLSSDGLSLVFRMADAGLLFEGRYGA